MSNLNEPTKQNTFESDSREVFCYLRVSTSHQNVGSQLHAIQKYCKQNGIQNYKLFQDEAVSGAKDSRPALNVMMKEIGDGKCKMLIVFAFSRFSRSCTHLLQSLEFLKKNGCRFLSISEQVDTSTHIGVALLAVLGALAQLERDLIRDRVIAGLERARKNGVHIGRKKTRPSELIRKLYLTNVSYSEISRICGVSAGAIGSEVNLMKVEMGVEKIRELRAAAKRRRVIAFKSEYDPGEIKPIASQPEKTPQVAMPPMPSPLKETTEPVSDPVAPSAPIEVITS